MKTKEAMRIINSKKKEPPKPKPQKGFMVSFEVQEGNFLRSDHFPDKHAGEKLIPTEAKAWDLAEKLANATDDNIINIYVTDANFSPIPGYDKREFKSY